MKRTRESNSRSGIQDMSQYYPPKVDKKLHDDHLGAKTSPILHDSSDDDSIDLPPGFENYLQNKSKVDLSHIPKIKWECPPSVVLSPRWLVAAGEESMEEDTQKLRDMRVLEAIYPRLSDIPPSPLVSADVRDEVDYDDNNTPRVPIIPIEDISAAILEAITKRNEQIDMNLLVQIFSDPKMIENLMMISQPAGMSTTSTSKNAITMSTMGLLPHGLTNASLPSSSPAAPTTTTTTTVVNDAQTSNAASKMAYYQPSASGDKDAKFYHELVRQHGGAHYNDYYTQDVKAVYSKQAQVKARRKMKPCIYYKSPRGCRNGDECLFKHTK